MPDLIVIVDPDYAGQLEKAAESAPVWIVATEINRNTCERLWKSSPHADHREKGAITSYNISNPEDRLGNLTGIIPQLELHHGEWDNDDLAFPRGFVLEAIGLELTDEVADALREFGFISFDATPQGFTAHK
jgi:hypothetical protein